MLGAAVWCGMLGVALDLAFIGEASGSSQNSPKGLIYATNLLTKVQSHLDARGQGHSSWSCCGCPLKAADTHPGISGNQAGRAAVLPLVARLPGLRRVRTAFLLDLVFLLKNTHLRS